MISRSVTVKILVVDDENIEEKIAKFWKAEEQTDAK